ncbi:MAG TPA: fibronectin type III domain-containing protein, partial [Thermoanaerobaculia bacterium]|nr:fibronectin type III domain-containing protein [Thermoanaerobaculia bacterium]
AATSATTVKVSWNAVAGADLYDVERSTDGQTYTFAGTTASTSLTDPGRTADTAYLYRVRARRTAGAASAYSLPDLATTVIFTDPALTPQSSVVRAAHITELRRAVNAVRVLAGIGAVTFEDTPPALLRAVHVTSLRGALEAARAALALHALPYTDATITQGVTVAKAAHVAELRTGVE